MLIIRNLNLISVQSWTYLDSWGLLAVAGAALFEKRSRGTRKRATNSWRTGENTGSEAINPPFITACGKDCYARIALLSHSRCYSQQEQSWPTKALARSFEIDGCLLQPLTITANEDGYFQLTSAPFSPGGPGAPGAPRGPCKKTKQFID